MHEIRYASAFSFLVCEGKSGFSLREALCGWGYGDVARLVGGGKKGRGGGRCQSLICWWWWWMGRRVSQEGRGDREKDGSVGYAHHSSWFFFSPLIRLSCFLFLFLPAYSWAWRGGCDLAAECTTSHVYLL